RASRRHSAAPRIGPLEEFSSPGLFLTRRKTGWKMFAESRALRIGPGAECRYLSTRLCAIKIYECHQGRSLNMPKILKPVRRRAFIQAGLALGASQVIGAPFILTARGDEPVKIGMVNPLTGVLAALAQSEVDGAKYAEGEINKKGGILGRPVQLFIEDSANDVGTGVQKTRKL